MYEWTVEWALRDDDKPSMGGLQTFKTLTAARAFAERKLAESRKLAGDGKEKDWTWIKFVQITGTPSLAAVEDLDPKAAKVWQAIRAGLDKKAEACNYLVQDIAAAARAPGLDGKTADEMWGYFRTVAEKDGWVTVKGQPSAADRTAIPAVELANRMAAEGHLVVGVLPKELLNKYYPNRSKGPYEYGHVFVVTPGGGGDWKSTLVANAVLGGGDLAQARLIPATKVVASKHQPVYEFYAYPLSKK